jgi:uncharacterized protein (UPF0128 family)
MTEKEKVEKTPLNFDVLPDLYKQIEDEAKRLGISVAGFMRMLAVQYFEKRVEVNSGNSRENRPA